MKDFWNLQRFYQGIDELISKDALFNIIPDNQGISIRMRTYIVIDYIRKAFEKLGYTTNEQVLNAASFGVPQTRERFILIGVLNEYRELKKNEIILPCPLIENPNEYITVAEAIGDLEEYNPTTGDMNVDLKLRDKQTIDSYYNIRKIYHLLCWK